MVAKDAWWTSNLLNAKFSKLVTSMGCDKNWALSSVSIYNHLWIWRDTVLLRGYPWKNKVGPLRYTHHRREITANSLPYSWRLLSRVIKLWVGKDCGWDNERLRFESIHSCYVRRLRVVLRNVSAVLVITLNISCFLKYIFFQQDQIVVAEWLIFSLILL